MKAQTKQYLTLAAVLAGGYVAYKAYTGAGEVVEKVNPTNQNNVFNTGFNSLYRSATGSEGTLGTDLAGVISG